MRPEYKLTKVYKPYCPQCGKELLGNGSKLLPYKCACGEWEYDFVKREYKIKK